MPTSRMPRCEKRSYALSRMRARASEWAGGGETSLIAPECSGSRLSADRPVYLSVDRAVLEMSVDNHERRKLFRELNERIRAIHHALGGAPRAYEVFCECGRPRCLVRLEVPAALFEHVRESKLVLVHRGHVDQGGERIVTASGDYCVLAPAEHAPTLGLSGPLAGPAPA